MPARPQHKALATLTASLVAAAVALGGCYRPGGGMFYMNPGPLTYFSTEMMPATVTVVDTRTEEPFFSIEIPPGKELVLTFIDDEGDDPVKTPDLMKYRIFKLGTTTGSLNNSLTVPNAACRRIDVDYREGPELAERPHEEKLRSDQQSEHPAWWTAEGGTIPQQKNEQGRTIYDD